MCGVWDCGGGGVCWGLWWWRECVGGCVWICIGVCEVCMCGVHMCGVVVVEGVCWVGVCGCVYWGV